MISSNQNCADQCGIVRPLIVGLFLYRFQALSGGFWNHIGVVPHGWVGITLYDNAQDITLYDYVHDVHDNVQSITLTHSNLSY